MCVYIYVYIHMLPSFAVVVSDLYSIPPPGRCKKRILYSTLPSLYTEEYYFLFHTSALSLWNRISYSLLLYL